VATIVAALLNLLLNLLLVPTLSHHRLSRNLILLLHGLRADAPPSRGCERTVHQSALVRHRLHRVRRVRELSRHPRDGGRARRAVGRRAILAGLVFIGELVTLVNPAARKRLDDRLAHARLGLAVIQLLSPKAPARHNDGDNDD
jgi:hypothetical protein